MSSHMDYDGYLKNKKTSVGKDIERLEGLYIASRNVKWYNHCRKQFGGPSIS